MKIRMDFVTNSSSSSFVILKKNLDGDQIQAIREHVRMGKYFNIASYEEEWEIQENSKYIGGRVILDNFFISELFDYIGISDDIVEWGDWFNFKLPSDTGSVQETHKNEPWREFLNGDVEV